MSDTIKDAKSTHWVYRLPQPARSFAQLSRLDRPIGYWLLALPGWIGLAFASLSHGFATNDLKWAALILIGAIAMRGAGCTYNDIVDQDLDAKVERTALRPLPAGNISTSKAWAWLLSQCLVGLIVLIMLPVPAQMLALLSLPLVAAYPFMKRITWWPQIWLGMTFNWAVLVAYACSTSSHWEMSFLESLYLFMPSSSLNFNEVFSTFTSLPVLILYFGLIFWTVGYDTIYACQDVEDDAVIGVKSTALRMGARVKIGVGLCYFGFALALLIATVAAVYNNTHFVNSSYHSLGSTFELISIPLRLSLAVFLPAFVMMFFIVAAFDPQETEKCLTLFKRNFWIAISIIVGLIAFVVLLDAYSNIAQLQNLR